MILTSSSAIIITWKNTKSMKYKTREPLNLIYWKSELRGNCKYILGLLPEECAEVLRLFFEGLNTEEIALKLGKTKQTIYNKKHEAISILKKKISKEDIFLITLFFKPIIIIHFIFSNSFEKT